MVKGMEVFSAPEDKGLFERVADAWEFVEGFPLPRFDMTCACGSTDLKLCNISFCKKDSEHITQKGGMQYACDMVYRCRTCAHMHYYGLAIPQHVYELRGPGSYHWEKALAVIQGARMQPITEVRT